MVYKNLFYRLLLSLFLILIFFLSFDNKYMLFILGTFVYILVLYEVFKYFKKFYKLILFYLFFSYLSFALYFLIFFDYLIFNIFVFTIIIFDSFSYFTGKLYGKNHIFKFISPNKTLEGYLGGIIFTNTFFVCFFYFISNEIKFITLIIFINLIIFISMSGDLTESYFKRKNNIKDSSKFLPGHGGYFDRFDSFIASIIMLTLLSTTINL